MVRIGVQGEIIYLIFVIFPALFVFYSEIDDPNIFAPHSNWNFCMCLFLSVLASNKLHVPFFIFFPLKFFCTVVVCCRSDYWFQSFNP